MSKSSTATSLANSFRTIANSRHSVKRFQPGKSIPKEHLTDILKTSLTSPSGFNIQPTQVILVQDQSVKEYVSKHAMLGAGNKYRTVDASLLAVFLSDLEIHKRIPRILQLEREHNVRDAGYMPILPIASSFTIDESPTPSLSTMFKKIATQTLSQHQPMPTIESVQSWSYKNTSLLAQTFVLAATSYESSSDIALFVPYVFIESAIKACDGKYFVGAEGVCPEMNGAFTGAVSASMLNSIGVQWALAGHSERRVIFGETDEYINGQVLKLLDEGMSCMLCIGESEAEYEQNLVGSVCAVQLKKDLAGVTKEQMARVAVAYEPIWAIGTGKVATPATAQSVHKTCRDVLSEIFDEEVADATRILYGGSVTPDSIDELMGQEDIDGVLVGGASLDSTKFNRIINFQV